ncbi:MAG: hypothetical protein J6L96_07790 [Clostridia bacterium]|nr:hypothetical protein [Clostridia bacterium]
MTLLFFEIARMSLSASIVAVAVILIKLLLKKAPRWIHCLMWMLVAVRLVCPFAIESSFSVMPSKSPIDNSTYQSYEQVFDNEQIIPIIPSGYGESITEQPNIQNGSACEKAPLYIEPQVEKERSWQEISSWIWLAGALLMAAYGIGSYLRFRKKVSPSIHVQDKVYICDYIDSPFILGLICPRIYIPSSLSERERDHVTAHEMAHIKRCDHLWKPLGFALLALHWFNPLIWLAYILLCRDIEIACDERVIGGMDTYHRREYTTVLLSCSIQRRMISACPLAFGEVSVKWRIKNVLTYRKPTLLIIIAAVVAVTVASVCLLTDPVSAQENNEIPDDEYVETVVPDKEGDSFEPQLLTEVYYDIDGDGEEEYLVISDPSNRNNGFPDLTRDVSIYKNGYKEYYNIFIPYDHVSELYFEPTDEGLKIARQYKGEWELSAFSEEYLREGRLVIEPTENIMIDSGMIGAYSEETQTRRMFYIDVGVIVDMGTEDNVVIVNGQDFEPVYGSMSYIVVKPLIPGTQMFCNWEADTFRFWIGEGYTNEELQIGDTVKIVHNGGWGGSERELGPASGPVDISKMPSDALYISGEAYIVCADKLAELKAELSNLQDRYVDKNPR